MLHTPLQGISISMKNKKVMPVESYVMPKNKKRWSPPFSTQCPYSPGLSWDELFFEKKKKWQICYGRNYFGNFEKKVSKNISKRNIFFQTNKVFVYRGKKFFFSKKQLFLLKIKWPLNCPFWKMYTFSFVLK